MPTLAPLRPVDTGDLVRVGRDNDGGYVICERVCAATEVLIGLGINTDWSFEADFVRRNPRVRVVGVDGSISPDEWKARALRELRYALLRLARVRPGAVRDAWRDASEMARLGWGFTRFFRGRHRFVQRFITATPSSTSITWASLADSLRSVPGAPLPPTFLKMDIELAEYDVLPDVLHDERDLDALVGIALEGHACATRWPQVMELVERLRERFAIVHVHGNNCAPLAGDPPIPDVLELTFVHRRLLTDAEQRRPSERAYPLPRLDQPNAPALPDYQLSF